MKRHIATVILGCGLCQAALAGSSSPITPEYYNYGYLTNSPTVDALSFFNAGYISIDAVFSTSSNFNGVIVYGFNALPFATKDTLFYTNTVSGTLQAYPGFLFDTATSTTRHNASFFVNQGLVQGLDVPADAAEAVYQPYNTTVQTIVPALGQPIPSELLVESTNVFNSGAMSVGNDGLLSLQAQNVTNAFGALSAGYVNTIGPTNEDYDLTGIQGQDGALLYNNGPYYFVPSLGVYDLFWGITNAFTVDVSGLDFPKVPNIPVADRGIDVIAPGIPANANAVFAATADFYSDATGTNLGTNLYYNVIFVNTNIANTNISVSMGFTGAEDLQYFSTTVPVNADSKEDIVQFSEPVYDVITGQTVTNGIYLIDDGAYLPTMSESLNASQAGPYNRPNTFEVTTTTPIDWLEAEPGDFVYESQFIYTNGTFNATKVPFEISEYGAQIGRNPEAINGSFSSLADSNEFDLNTLAEGYLDVNLPDPTNEPGRIEISANNLNISQARLRAEGMVILNVTNLIGAGTAAVDWGEANVNIGVSNGLLNISNIFPTSFIRLRGDIYAWSATWENTQTNNLTFGLGTITGTNQWHYHVLVVDQNLFGNFTPVVRNLTLSGSHSVVLQDNLNVINQSVINTTNLTIASAVSFAQNAENVAPATTPSLENLFIATNGSLTVANILDVGYNVDKGQSAPGGRTYTVSSITNFGQITSTSPLFQSAIFENEGNITADKDGSILIEASNLCLGLASTATNAINTLTADGSVDLSAVSIRASNSVINTGLFAPSALILDATAELSDGVSGIPTTNTNSVIINHWTVTGGFSMPNKPAIGDLFGTEIHTIATNEQYVTHVWAGTDWGNNIAKGFSDNEVIGQLLLDRESSNSILHFSAAGARNAMYVDDLNLTNYAYTNYRTGLIIDPNFVIYFADCNGDPVKLQEIYTNLIWVTNFVGPNSTYVAPYFPPGSGLYCLMNKAVANSTQISFWNGIANYYLLNGLDGMPAWPYLLNDPSDPSSNIECNSSQINGTYSFSCDCVPGTNVTQLLYTNQVGTNLQYDVLTVAYNGDGSILNIPTQSQLAPGHSYTLTAVPAAGWVFDNWQTAILGNVITSYSNVLTFAFVSNTVVTANFIPAPFPELQGEYSGLFFETNGIEPASSGAVSLTLTKTGTFSGKLLMGSTNYTFTSQFTGSGMAEFLAKSGKQTLTVDLQLDVTNLVGQITGEVNGGTWEAALAADLAPTWTAKNPSPLTGAYTMSLPWETGTDTNDVGGDSYGTGTVSKLGVLTLGGMLSDGATFSVSAPVNQDGQWPCYAYSASKKDWVVGWVTVSNSFGAVNNGLSGTNISWVKEASAGPLYKNGFNNVLQMVGSVWQAPARGADALSLYNPGVTLSGGGLPQTLVIPVKLQSTTSFSATNLSLSINAATGAFSGSFVNPANKKRVALQGVVLPNESSARGFFLGADDSGAVLLGGQ